MTLEVALNLIANGVKNGPAVWADLGAGSGVFTLALDEILGFGGVIFAVDSHLGILRDHLKSSYSRTTVHLYEQNILKEMNFLPALDGILLANILHDIPHHESFLGGLCNKYLKPGGSLLVIEYDRYDEDRWVPYPLPLPHFQRLASNLQLSLPEEVGRMKSIYANQELYASVCFKERLDSQRSSDLQTDGSR